MTGAAGSGASWRRWNRWSVWAWLLFAITAGMAISKLLRADTDFGIFLEAAREVAAGDVDIYRSRATTGAYSYPHWVLLPLLPLLALPEALVRVLYGLSLGWATVWIVGDIRRSVGARVQLRGWHWLLFGLLFARWFSANYTNGQLSLWVAAWTIRGIVLLDPCARPADEESVMRRRSVLAGVAIGAAAAAKLTPLAFLVALPLMGALTAAAAMAVTVVGLIFVVPALFLGLDEHLRHLGDLYDAMIRPLFTGGEGGDAAIWSGPNASVQGTVRSVLQDGRVDPALEPRTHWLDLEPAALRAVQLGWSAVLVVVCAFGFLRARRGADRVLVQGAIVCVAAALFSPLTRTYHCSLLLLAGMLFVVDRPGALGRRVVWGLVAAGFAFSMTLRQKSLLGRDLWYVFDRVGMLHLAIVGMLALLATRPLRAVEAGAGRGAPPVPGS